MLAAGMIIIPAANKLIYFLRISKKKLLIRKNPSQGYYNNCKSKHYTKNTNHCLRGHFGRISIVKRDASENASCGFFLGYSLFKYKIVCFSWAWPIETLIRQYYRYLDDSKPRSVTLLSNRVIKYVTIQNFRHS